MQHKVHIKSSRHYRIQLGSAKCKHKNVHTQTLTHTLTRTLKAATKRSKMRLSENSRARKFRKCCEKVNAHKQSNLPSFWMKKPRVAINLVVLWTSSECAPLTGFSLGQCGQRSATDCWVFAWVLAVFELLAAFCGTFQHTKGAETIWLPRSDQCDGPV